MRRRRKRRRRRIRKNWRKRRRKRRQKRRRRKRKRMRRKRRRRRNRRRRWLHSAYSSLSTRQTLLWPNATEVRGFGGIAMQRNIYTHLFLSLHFSNVFEKVSAMRYRLLILKILFHLFYPGRIKNQGYLFPPQFLRLLSKYK